MSKCMTIDETIDQKETCTETPPKDIVDFVLEEALLSAFITSDKGCSRIGDFSVTEDFRQQYDHLRHQKDFEQVNHTQTKSTDHQESIHNFGQTVERSANRGNLGLIIDSYVDEKLKPSTEYTVINEDALANNELQIQNGQIHLEKNTSNISEFQEKEDVNRIVETKQLSEGNLSNIFMTLNQYSSDGDDCISVPEGREAETEMESCTDTVYSEDPKRPFEPLTTEDLRKEWIRTKFSLKSTLQVWGNENSSLVGKWDGDILAQKEEAVRLMEELSSVHVFPDNSVSDPNRPRACAFDEEDVRKMTKEIEEIRFINCHDNPEDSDTAYRSDGKGDADLESKTSTKIKDNTSKSQMLENFSEDDIPDRQFEVTEVTSSDQVLSSGVEHTVRCDMLMTSVTGEYPCNNENDTSQGSTDVEHDLPYNVTSDRQRSEWSFWENEVLINNRTAESPQMMQNMDCFSSHYSTTSSGHDTVGSISVSEYLSPKELRNESIPSTKSFIEDISSSLSSSKLVEFALKNLEFTAEVEFYNREKQSNKVESPPSLNELQETSSESNNSIQQGTINLERTGTSSTETNKWLNPQLERDSQLLSMDTNLFVTKMEEIRESQDAGNLLQGSSLSCENLPNYAENRHLISQEINSQSYQNFENFQEPRVLGSELNTGGEEERHGEVDDGGHTTAISDSNKIPDDGQGSNGKDDTPTASQKSFQVEESEEKDLCSDLSPECSAASDTCVQTFKLHSQKMYWGPNHDLACPLPNEFNLTESEEGLIDMRESVIQVIDPPESDVENSENSDKITFSLLSEPPVNMKNIPLSTESEPKFGTQAEEEFSFSDNEFMNVPQRVYSGMTTIGPIKNADRDPKDLTASEIDFGKMTRITSSRQLGKDMSMFSTEVTTVKIVEEDDSDDDLSIRTEDERLDHTSLVNRDIASLTKVQKIREVMSHQPKSDEDFEDKDVLPRPRLDLKDVESLTDERYKVTDMNIPILSFELNDNNLNSEKELMDSIGLVISGVADPTFFDEDDDAEYDRLQDISIDKLKVKDSGDLEPDVKQIPEDISATTMEREVESAREIIPEGNSSEEFAHVVDSRLKFSTLGSVFRKASSKLIRKEVEVLVSHSKSLPRETSKTSTTDSIRSMIDDCQSSATNMLKKSRSLLRNTQSVFKSISQSRMSSSAGREHQSKLSPSESDVSNIERRFSSFLKKEDFVKAKNIIKDKVEKSLKSFEKNSEKDMTVAIRNTENLQVEPIENFKKLLPKSPLVYKSQFVKSLMDVQSNPLETSSAASTSEVVEEEKSVEKLLTAAVSDKVLDEGKESQNELDWEKEISLQEKLLWSDGRENQKNQEKELLAQDDSEPQVVDYIVMETVQGLPATDLESPSSEKENLNIETIEKMEITNEVRDTSGKVKPSNSSQIFSDSNHDIAPCFPEIDGEQKMTKPPPERKTKTKKKNLKAKLRSFWCSAFGKVKTPQGKCEVP